MNYVFICAGVLEVQVPSLLALQGVLCGVRHGTDDLRRGCLDRDQRSYANARETSSR